jgi:hypothetical protein
MRGRRIIQTEKQVIFQRTGGVCAVGDDVGVSGALTSLLWGQRTMGAGTLFSQYPSSFRLTRLILNP